MMERFAGKKGQVFSLLAIFIVVLMFVSFEIASIIQERQSIETRISTMETFLLSLEKNLERQMFISGFRIIFLAEDEIVSTGNYLVDVDHFFNEAFFNGTVDGDPEDILNGATYGDLIDSMNSKANKINVDVVLTDSNVYVSQEDPWNVKFTLVSDFVMEDKSGLAKWEKQQNISGLIPVTGFEDPFYTINTNAKISKKINQTIYEGNYAEGSDVSNLVSHVNGNYYTTNVNAPNFLDRLEGTMSADPSGNGIESFVNTNQLSLQGISVFDKSTIDYIYFSTDNPIDYSVSGMPSWFRIDGEDGHLAKYNVTGLISS